MEEILRKMLVLLEGIEVKGEQNMTRLLACIRAIREMQNVLSKPDGKEVKDDA